MKEVDLGERWKAKMSRTAKRAMDIACGAPVFIVVVGAVTMLLPAVAVACLRFGAKKTLNPMEAAFKGAARGLKEYSEDEDNDFTDPADWWKDRND